MIQTRHDNDTKDCSVVAMSIALDKPYDEVHEVFAKCGRKFGQGTWQSTVFGVLYEFDVEYRRFNRFEIQELCLKHLGIPDPTFKQVVSILHPHRRYYASSKKHAVGIVNGVIKDWSKDTDRKVISLIEIL